ncbi:MAG: alpha/beta hydrolase-fold protein [Planctomycetaceae bacterium]|nr:alpha/beta hydrolase-fold protein [Planctomycetaceae bacterium]
MKILTKQFICIAFLFLGLFLSLGHVYAAKYILRDGRVIEGRMTQLSRVDERAGTPDLIGRLIVVVDDGLRRVYFSKTQLLRPNEEALPKLEVFRTGQSVNTEGQVYHIPGNYANTTPFDQYGRRVLRVFHSGGVALVEQSIVELNPYYVRVTSERADQQPVNWEMRIATNAIPREQITPIVMNIINAQNFDDRMRLVRFYLEGGLYYHADAELESVMLEWKDDPDVQPRLRAMSMSIRQSMYEQYINELELRWDSGQYRLVGHLLTELEQEPKLPERLFLPVRRMLQRFDDTAQRCQDIIAAMRELNEQLPDVDKNDKIPAIITEIEKELNFATLRRLTTFDLYARDSQLSPDEKLAIGITGWYAGTDASNNRLAVALMLPETERLIAAYLRSGRDHLLRQRILEQLKNLESARPDLIAAILATMRPPLSDLPAGDPEAPGYYRFKVPNPLVAPGAPRFAGVPEFHYAVQLPPDYNPHQRYPMIVTLNGSQTPDTQIDWWVGMDRMRHAARYGYIVIAPEWNPQRKSEYDFSIFSHAAVLGSMRDALRRFSVNTDKVFISGHGIGGTAAWDIAQSHPDLWAGAVVFNGVASKYIDTYWESARHVPLYLVWGEMEGLGTGTTRKWEANATVLNNHLQEQHRPGDFTVVRYIGRGMENFSEEVLNVLDWMNLKQRTVAPTTFEVKTIRPGDSFFWWVEMPNLLREHPGRMIDPIDFPSARNAIRPITVESRLNRGSNSIRVTTTPSVANAEVLLSPEMIDFRERATVTVNNNPYTPPSGMIEPDIEVMLEDVRTRGDRLHPFWAVLTGRP